MPQESVELLWKLLEEEPGREMTVSLENRTVTCGDVTLPFEVNDYTRWRLMNGYDDIDLTLQDRGRWPTAASSDSGFSGTASPGDARCGVRAMPLLLDSWTGGGSGIGAVEPGGEAGGVGAAERGEAQLARPVGHIQRHDEPFDAGPLPPGRGFSLD